MKKLNKKPRITAPESFDCKEVIEYLLSSELLLHGRKCLWFSKDSKHGAWIYFRGRCRSNGTAWRFEILHNVVRYLYRAGVLDISRAGGVMFRGIYYLNEEGLSAYNAGKLSQRWGKSAKA